MKCLYLLCFSSEVEVLLFILLFSLHSILDINSVRLKRYKLLIVPFPSYNSPIQNEVTIVWGRIGFYVNKTLNFPLTQSIVKTGAYCFHIETLLLVRLATNIIFITKNNYINN